jgi:outer membrane cobalamin receptor
MKTIVIAALVGGVIAGAPVAAFAQDTTPAPAPTPTPAPTASIDIPGASSEGHVVYTPADFARYSPKNALDMINQVPGFSISGGDQGRGLGEANVNVLINGERLALKSESIFDRLTKISADKVERIEIVDGASLKIPGLSGQVANIVTKAGGISGQFEWDTRFRPGYVSPEWFGGNVSISGTTKTLEYTLAFRNDFGTGSIKGPDHITDATGRRIEDRFTHVANHFDGPKVSGTLKWDGPGSSVAHFNASYQQTYFNGHNDEERTVPAGYDGHDYYPFDDDRGLVDRHRDYEQRERDRNYEIGGDFEFALGPGRLKLIGLDRYDRDRYHNDVVFIYSDGSPNTGGRYASISTTREDIARAEYNWKMLGGDWQLSGEGAFNRYHGTARLFSLDTTGSLVEIPFPSGTGGVTEDRYESILTHSRQLAPNLSLQLSGGVEYSKLQQTGSRGLTRTFWRPKGYASLSWTPHKGLDLSLKLARVVGQLSFGDFLARVDLEQGNGSAGNVNLVPPQSWELNFEAKKDLGAWGTTTFKLYGKRYQDFIEWIPLPGGVESRGNIDKANLYGLAWISTFQLDPLGWKGAKIDANVTLEHSSLRDPLTGETHQFSNEYNRVVNVTLRDDIPSSDWAWGAGVQYNHVLPYYRMFEVGLNYEGPAYTFAFIENKDVFGLDVRAQVFNITNGRSIFRRTVYDAFRDTGAVIFHEDANRAVGAIYSLTVKGKF